MLLGVVLLLLAAGVVLVPDRCLFANCLCVTSPAGPIFSLTILRKTEVLLKRLVAACCCVPLCCPAYIMSASACYISARKQVAE
jgi:hypothetical protein